MSQKMDERQGFRDLPFEIVFLIADNLLLSDIVTLATFTVFPKALLQEHCDIPARSAARLLYLRQLESHSRKSVRLHRWSKHEIEAWDPLLCGQDASVDSRHGVFLHTDTYLPASIIQLVKRAQYNQGEGFGLPIKALSRKYRSPDGWKVSTDAVFTQDNSLVLKVTSSIPLQDLTESVNVQLCACCDKQALQSWWTCRRIIDAQVAEHCDTLGDFRTVTDAWSEDRMWYQCRGCLGVVARHCGFGRVPVLNTDPAVQFLNRKIELVRYHDLGPVSCMEYEPSLSSDMNMRLLNRDYIYLPGLGFRYLGKSKLFERFSCGRRYIEAGGLTNRFKRLLNTSSQRTLGSAWESHRSTPDDWFTTRMNAVMRSL